MDKLVGIHGPREHIIEWFSRKEHDENLKVLAVVGSGGLGKTTLANQVYRQLKPQFQCSAFVSVSRNPHIKMVFRQILTELGVTDYSSDDERQLVDRIRDYLGDKRKPFSPTYTHVCTILLTTVHSKKKILVSFLVHKMHKPILDTRGLTLPTPVLRKLHRVS